MVESSDLQCEGLDGDVHGLRGCRVHVSLEEHLTRLQYCGHVFPLFRQEGTRHHLKENQHDKLKEAPPIIKV